MDSERALQLASLRIDGRSVPLRAGELLAIRRLDVDGLRDVGDPEMRTWTAWASAYNMFPVNREATISARATDGRRLEGPAIVATTVTPSGTYLEMNAPANGRLGGLDGWLTGHDD